MTRFSELLDHVDPGLSELIRSNEDFKIYKSFSRTTNVLDSSSIKGSLALEIDPRQPIGLSISPSRG